MSVFCEWVHVPVRILCVHKHFLQTLTFFFFSFLCHLEWRIWFFFSSDAWFALMHGASCIFCISSDFLLFFKYTLADIRQSYCAMLCVLCWSRVPLGELSGHEFRFTRVHLSPHISRLHQSGSWVLGLNEVHHTTLNQTVTTIYTHTKAGSININFLVLEKKERKDNALNLHSCVLGIFDEWQSFCPKICRFDVWCPNKVPTPF